MRRKGVILAGGAGTRLHPLTLSASKQLLPVYNKPMIYYPLCTLMQAGIRDIMIIVSPEHEQAFVSLFDDGGRWGVNIRYAVQERPEGIAQAFLIAEDFIQGYPSALVLGDNLFHGSGFSERLLMASSDDAGATVFTYRVDDPERYGVLVLDEEGRPNRIIEKPPLPSPSDMAVTGLYFYDDQVVDVARTLRPSARGELEITDVNNWYLVRGQMRAIPLGRGMAWLDTGTHESLLHASNYIQAIEKRQGLMVASPEETAWRMGFIDDAGLESLAETSSSGPHMKAYITRILSSRMRGD